MFWNRLNSSDVFVLKGTKELTQNLPGTKPLETWFLPGPSPASSLLLLETLPRNGLSHLLPYGCTWYALKNKQKPSCIIIFYSFLNVCVSIFVLHDFYSWLDLLKYFYFIGLFEEPALDVFIILLWAFFNQLDFLLLLISLSQNSVC